jgi:hypothetical protein
MTRKRIALAATVLAVLVASFGGKFWGQSVGHPGGDSPAAAQNSQN